MFYSLFIQKYKGRGYGVIIRLSTQKAKKTCIVDTMQVLNFIKDVFRIFGISPGF